MIYAKNSSSSDKALLSEKIICNSLKLKDSLGILIGWNGSE